MFSKLADVARKFEEMTDRLASGTLDVKEMTRLAREQAALKEVVETYADYRKTGAEIKAVKESLAEESDEAMRALFRQETVDLERKITELTGRLKILLIPKDPRDEKNTILEIRAGTGGEEASLFAGNLFRMYARYAEMQGWRVEILSDNPTDKGGFKEVIALISGERVFSRLKFEGGIHRVQRVPETEASGRIHTSAVTVAVMPEADDVDIDVPDSEIHTDVFRAGGKGGQGVNTTDSAVRLTHVPTGIVVICQDERSQHKNRAKALKVLRARLLDRKEQEILGRETAARRAMVGSGDRSEKIRTYNFPQSRVTDHRIGLTLHQLPDILEGKLTRIIDALMTHAQAEALKNDAPSQNSGERSGNRGAGAAS